MDTLEQPKRPWWKRKRTWAALVLLPVPYFAGLGPMAYAVGRGWVSDTTVDAYCKPLEELCGRRNRRIILPDGLGDFIERCADLGQRHAAAD